MAGHPLALVSLNSEAVHALLTATDGLVSSTASRTDYHFSIAALIASPTVAQSCHFDGTLTTGPIGMGDGTALPREQQQPPEPM